MRTLYMSLFCTSLMTLGCRVDCQKSRYSSIFTFSRTLLPPYQASPPGIWPMYRRMLVDSATVKSPSTSTGSFLKGSSGLFLFSPLQQNIEIRHGQKKVSHLNSLRVTSW